MRFYKIEMEIKTESDENGTRYGRGSIKGINMEFGHALAEVCGKYTERIADKGFLFLSYASLYECSFGLILKEVIDVNKFINGLIKAGKWDAGNIRIEETTFNDFYQMLQSADRNSYVYDDYEILREFELEDLVARGPRGQSLCFEERLIREREKEGIYLSANGYFTKETFIPELNRIFSKSSCRKAFGHPVDYMIESDDERTQKGMTQLILQALYNVGRVENHRYCEIEMDPMMGFAKRAMEALYKSCAGGAVVIDFYTEKLEDEDIAHGDYSFIPDLCKIIRRHCRDVLTVICLPRVCMNLRMMILENMENITFVEIKEELAIDDAATGYLKDRAKEFKIRHDKDLLAKVEQGHGYLATELNSIFDEWYSRKLKMTVYSQYKDIVTAKSEAKEKKPKGSAYTELESMIGLRSAKKIINQALDSYKAQVVFKEKGIEEDSLCNHMIFTGNPGTAKTTVARLFARILKDNNVLARGHIVEVGRGDLVGRFVGWTAPIIKAKFKEAKGGILFIDEAYSLVDDRNGSFGDEAINTIVQEMENHRGELIVIFAGYPDKMEGFLDKNPGLRSRIAHYVHFEDYDTDELCQIAKLVASQKGLELEKGALEKIRTIVEEAKLSPDFGNGRYIRNLIEKAKMAQSSRLLHMDYDKVTQEEIKKIRVDDIEVPLYSRVKKKRHIGFSA